MDGGGVVVPVAEVQGDGLLVVDVAVLGVLHGAVLPYQVLPVNLRQALLGLFQRQYAVVLLQVLPSGLVTPPAAAVRVAHGLVGLGGVVLL